MDQERIIELEDVTKSFGDKKVHLGINLSVFKGETITVLGGSGSGKSVLLKEVNGLIRPDSGRVCIKGEYIENMDEGELTEIRKNIGMLFQGAALFDSLTVQENIAYPLIERAEHDENEIREIVARNLDLVGLPGIEDKMPSDLSGGMKKRVGLARAMATTPEILLYDEPTTGLDPPNVSRINDLINDMNDKFDVTGVVITHDLESAFAVSDRVAFLCEGKIVFVGTVEEAKNTAIETFSDFINGIMRED